MNNHSIYPGTQAIQRAVAILKAFGPDPARLTAQQLSQRTGLNRSTVYRLLSALEYEGLVAAGADGRYRLGPDMAILGTLALRQLDLRALALPLMRSLAEQSGETIDLEIRHGARVMIIEEVTGDHLLNASSNIGTLYPAHCTATGKLLLAALPADALEPILAAELCACGPRSITDPEALRADLQASLARGYATAYEELEAHLHAVAAPIYDHQGHMVAALSISGPSARLPRRREPAIAQMLIAACAKISAALGYRESVRGDAS
jgi:DNA-binding IclR family transcriptional regulator